MDPIKEWIIHEQEVVLYKNEILGEGQFGIVYKAEWRGLIVAVKQFKNLDDHQKKLVENEFKVMTKLHHPNIIQLLGIISKPFSIVMEYIPNGSLTNYLKRHPWTSINRKVIFMMDIAKGLAYLHGRKPSFIIHRDIKPTNFLVTKDLQIKIADFGICKILESEFITKSHENLQYIQDISATSNVGTLYYMAPELFSKQKRVGYSASVDIYSFGSVMYEIFEGHKIFHFCSTRERFIDYIIVKRYKPRFEKSLLFVKRMIIQCLNSNPLKRPTALEILKYLDHHRKKKWWLKFRF